MNSTTKAWIAAGVGILFSLGIIFWQVRASHAAPINLSADDMSLIASDQAPQMRMRLSSDDNARRDFAKQQRRNIERRNEHQRSRCRLPVYQLRLRPGEILPRPRQLTAS